MLKFEKGETNAVSDAVKSSYSVHVDMQQFDALRAESPFTFSDKKRLNDAIGSDNVEALKALVDCFSISDKFKPAFLSSCLLHPDLPVALHAAKAGAVKILRYVVEECQFDLMSLRSGSSTAVDLATESGNEAAVNFLKRLVE